jgi:energy-converting hydrogenase Eha subunit E
MEDIIVYAGGFILSIGAIATFIASKKYKVAKEVIEALNTIFVALGDGKLTKEESLRINKEVKDVISTIKK